MRAANTVLYVITGDVLVPTCELKPSTVVPPAAPAMTFDDIAAARQWWTTNSNNLVPFTDLYYDHILTGFNVYNVLKIGTENNPANVFGPAMYQAITSPKGYTYFKPVLFIDPSHVLNIASIPAISSVSMASVASGPAYYIATGDSDNSIRPEVTRATSTILYVITNHVITPTYELTDSSPGPGPGPGPVDPGTYTPPTYKYEHPVPPEAWICRECYWQLSLADGMKWIEFGSPPGTQAPY
jgi:hypothetical protein